MVAQAALRVCIHRGARQIGGTAIELEHAGSRLVLDLGLPLDAGKASIELLPSVPGLRESDPSLLAIVLSHGHGDHWGLLPLVRQDLPVISGAATERIQAAAAQVFGRPAPFKAGRYLEHRQSFAIGPFVITPYLVCHSGYDAYALLVEAGGRRLFYSGDLRSHGRKAGMFESLLRAPPRAVHAMLLEGSVLGRLEPDRRFETEGELETRLVQRFGEAPGLVMIAASAQNVDRVVSIHRAAKQSERRMVIDLYAAEVLEATGGRAIPSLLFDDVHFYLPWRQARWVKETGRFDLIQGERRARRVFAEEILAAPHRFVVLANGSFLEDRRFAPCIAGATGIWSQWEGYLRPGQHGARMKETLAAHGVTLDVMHTSGHADVPTLRRLVDAISPERLTPIHTFHPEKFPELFRQVVLRDDGEWWEV